MSNNNSMPPFKVGQGVVCIDDGDLFGITIKTPLFSIKKDDEYEIDELNQHPSSGRWYCWLKGMDKIREWEGITCYGYACQRFVPIQESYSDATKEILSSIVVTDEVPDLPLKVKQVENAEK